MKMVSENNFSFLSSFFLSFAGFQKTMFVLFDYLVCWSFTEEKNTLKCFPQMFLLMSPPLIRLVCA